MAREFFDYDPVTGLTEYLEFTSDGKFHITTEQDVQPFIDFAKEIANAGLADKPHGDVHTWAIIPPVVQAQMFKRGINILHRDDTKKVVADINANYPYLKLTHKYNHSLR